jgi:hypothetical protein
MAGKIPSRGCFGISPKAIEQKKESKLYDKGT